jgi:hypothetical protein
MDTIARILLSDRRHRNTLCSEQRARVAILQRRSMGIPTDLPAHRTNPNHQSRHRHRPRPRRHQRNKAQPRLTNPTYPDAVRQALPQILYPLIFMSHRPYDHQTTLFSYSHTLYALPPPPPFPELQHVDPPNCNAAVAHPVSRAFELLELRVMSLNPPSAFCC